MTFTHKTQYAKLCILGVYGTVLFIVASFHVIGQDEAQAWNIARASTYPWDILYHGEAEGHTPLWHFILWILSFTSVDIVPFFTAALAIIFAAALLRDEPFDLRICALLLFSYFTFYDYPTIPRPYMLALFFSTLFASALYRQQRNLLYLSLLLSLVAFTSAFGILLSAPLGILALTMLWREGWRPSLSWQLVVAIAGYVGTLAAAAYLIIFPMDTNEFSRKVVSGEYIGNIRYSDALTSSAFPHWKHLPLGIGDWLLDTTPGHLLVITGATVVAISVFFILAKRGTGSLAWLTALVIISAGSVYAGTGTTRHLGHLFIAAVCILWATSGTQPSTETAKPHGIGRLPIVILVMPLMYQLILGWYGATISVFKPLSAGKQIAEYIETNTVQPIKLITNNIHDIGPILSYLDIAAYDTVCDCWRQRADMSVSRNWNLTTLYEQWCRLHHEEQVTHALITTETPLRTDSRFELVHQFKAMVRDNTRGDFQLWKISSAGQAECSSE